MHSAKRIQLKSNRCPLLLKYDVWYYKHPYFGVPDFYQQNRTHVRKETAIWLYTNIKRNEVNIQNQSVYIKMEFVTRQSTKMFSVMDICKFFFLWNYCCHNQGKLSVKVYIPFMCPIFLSGLLLMSSSAGGFWCLQVKTFRFFKYFLKAYFRLKYSS